MFHNVSSLWNYKVSASQEISATTESQQGSLMQLIDTCADDVVKAGENALVAMYGGGGRGKESSLATCDTVNMTKKYVQKTVRSRLSICYQHPERLDSTA